MIPNNPLPSSPPPPENKHTTAKVLSGIAMGTGIAIAAIGVASIPLIVTIPFIYIPAVLLGGAIFSFGLAGWIRTAKKTDEVAQKNQAFNVISKSSNDAETEIASSVSSDSSSRLSSDSTGNTQDETKISPSDNSDVSNPETLVNSNPPEPVSSPIIESSAEETSAPRKPIKDMTPEELKIEAEKWRKRGAELRAKEEAQLSTSNATTLQNFPLAAPLKEKESDPPAASLQEVRKLGTTSETFIWNESRPLEVNAQNFLQNRHNNSSSVQDLPKEQEVLDEALKHFSPKQEAAVKARVKKTYDEWVDMKKREGPTIPESLSTDEFLTLSKELKTYGPLSKDKQEQYDSLALKVAQAETETLKLSALAEVFKTDEITTYMDLIEMTQGAIDQVIDRDALDRITLVYENKVSNLPSSPSDLMAAIFREKLKNTVEQMATKTNKSPLDVLLLNNFKKAYNPIATSLGLEEMEINMDTSTDGQDAADLAKALQEQEDAELARRIAEKDQR